MMQTIGSFLAKTHLPNLLDAVMKGEVFVITRRGKPVAMLSPIVETELTPAEAIKKLKTLREGVSWDGQGSTIEAREEGRR
ncbi:MAG: type II toxin-antitoxin system prevent-host-death family antitoxin [Gammaproteobacteria bacterium]|jgi:prevent-host-death family protein